MEQFREAILRSKIPRFNWNQVVGKPLTDWLYDMFDQKYGKIKTTHILLDRLVTFYRGDFDTQQRFTLKKLIESAKISVSARFSEWRVFRRRYG